MIEKCPLDDRCVFVAGHDNFCHIQDPDWRWVEIPDDPWNEITPNLFQGGSWVQPTADDFDVVVTLYKHAENVEDVYNYRWEIPDGALPNLNDLNATVFVVAWALARGKRVLVRCQAGLNRSGLVVARTLIEAGYKPDQAIRLIRTKRSEHALCNSNFENYLRGLK